MGPGFTYIAGSNGFRRKGAEMSGDGLRKLAYFLLLGLMVYVAVAGGA